MLSHNNPTEIFISLGRRQRGLEAIVVCLFSLLGGVADTLEATLTPELRLMLYLTLPWLPFEVLYLSFYEMRGNDSVILLKSLLRTLSIERHSITKITKVRGPKLSRHGYVIHYSSNRKHWNHKKAILVTRSDSVTSKVMADFTRQMSNSE